MSRLHIALYLRIHAAPIEQVERLLLWIAGHAEGDDLDKRIAAVNLCSDVDAHDFARAMRVINQ